MLVKTIAIPIEGELFVLGGILIDQEQPYNWMTNNDIFKLSCANDVCKWTKLPQQTKQDTFLLQSMIALAVPEDFLNCY